MEYASSISTSSSTNNSPPLREEGVMEMYLKSLKESIEMEISRHFKDKQDYSFNYKELKYINNLLIEVKLRGCTEINQFSNDILFYFKINENFPESSPVVTCNSKFVSPSLFDNRNLLVSLISNQWHSTSKLSHVIESIPKFLSKYSSDIKNRILTYYGEYKMDQLYEINDFLLNPENLIFKVEIEIDSSVSSNKELNTKKEIRYIIITDIFILIFNPNQTKCSDKSKATLSFIGEIREIDCFKHMKVFTSEKEKETKNLVGIKIKWDGYNRLFENTIILDYYESKKLIESINTRKKLLVENFSMFQEDMNVINSMIYNNSKIDNVQDDERKLRDMIEYKEWLYSEDSSNKENFNELMVLYQKFIEYLSARNNGDYSIYILKLQKLLETADKSNSFDSEKDNTDVRDDSFHLL